MSGVAERCCCAAIALSLFDMHKVAWRKALGGIEFDHRLTVRAPDDMRRLVGLRLQLFSFGGIVITLADGAR